MAVPWGLLSFLFRVVGPNVPELLSALKKHDSHEHPACADATDLSNLETRVTEIDRALSLQLDLIDQLTKQLRDIEHSVKRLMVLSILALAMGAFAVGMFLILGPLS